jgi:hypothetical protein
VTFDDGSITGSFIKVYCSTKSEISMLQISFKRARYSYSEWSR